MKFNQKKILNKTLQGKVGTLVGFFEFNFSFRGERWEDKVISWQSRIPKLTIDKKTLRIISKLETECMSQQILFFELLCIIQSMNNLRNTMETNYSE